MNMELRESSVLLALICSFLVSVVVSTDVTYDGRSFMINGERKIILSGSIHYPRSTPGMWPSLIRKAKEGGLNAIETYVFWNAHEPQYRQYDFSGNNDLVRFIKNIQDEGLYAVLRIGPYVCAEWNYGGFPVWLHNLPGIEMRTYNQVFMNEMKNFTTLIVEKMQQENFFASQGGPIIIAQIENEYGNVMGSYGQLGKDYINWCADLAQGYHIGIPWIMCQQSNAPQPMINTCNGYYCDQFHPNSPNSPKMWTENWVGWFVGWGMANPHRTAEDVSFAVARFFQYGGSFQNYYMYHGGTNFGRTSGGPYIVTTYDYDAPLDEYGNLNQPKWGHLKQLHLLLTANEKTLTYGDVNKTEYADSVTITSYSYQGQSVVFLGNARKSEDVNINFQNQTYLVPAWSVTILQGKTEVYNTAKVNVQTSIMVKEDNEDDLPGLHSTLQWSWKSEKFENERNGVVHHGIHSSKGLLDQKVITNGSSDYVWYMTSVHIKKSDPIWGKKKITLKVHTSGHIIHAYVNGKFIDYQYAPDTHYVFDFEKKIHNLKLGVNHFAFLSGTVGLANYGGGFDRTPVGIIGPVQLVATDHTHETTVRDLTSNKWIYKVGLNGEIRKFYSPHSNNFDEWYTRNLPTKKQFVWYKATFKTPLGSDPVVLDLMGLGKGEAWVNGQSIGRYWPSYIAQEKGCDKTCDYRGAYHSSKCLTGCGEPTQRWYHVPRSMLHDDDDNALVLFEEFGGNPWNVKVQTVTIGKICGNPYEGNTIELSCQGGKEISKVNFVSFGSPTGTCGSFKKGSCESAAAKKFVEHACVGKKSCSIDVSEKTLGATGCSGQVNRLAVEVLCG